MQHWYYALTLLFSVIFPIFWSFEPKLRFVKFWIFTVLPIFLVSIPFIAWDIYFTKIKVWGFNPSYHLGILFFGLPLEEILFFILVPFCCLFIFHSVVFLNWRILNIFLIKCLNYTILIISILGFVLYFNKNYTAFVTAGVAMIIIFNLIYQSFTFLSYFYTAFGLVLIPFLIVNGILTGVITPEPIVWYNNQENIHVQFFTIPLEDFGYNFILCYGNMKLFYWLVQGKND
jgi:lycopene cyclase domain-containing protein